MAPGHYPPPAGPPVPPGPLRSPGEHRKVRSEVLRLARENESWGCRRIRGELAGLAITAAPSTVREILKRAGIGPAPRRDGPGWAEFLRPRARGILALGFFTADLLNGTKVCVLAAIEHGIRRIRIKFVIHDRDASFSLAFDDVFMAAGARVIRSAVQAPRMSSIMERWIGNRRRGLQTFCQPRNTTTRADTVPPATNNPRQSRLPRTTGSSALSVFR